MKVPQSEQNIAERCQSVAPAFVLTLISSRAQVVSGNMKLAAVNILKVRTSIPVGMSLVSIPGLNGENMHEEND